MAYVKNVWTDQDVERPRTYRMTENQDGSVTLIDDFGLVTDLGTPVNADNMNHIEDGIAGAVDKSGDTMTGELVFAKTDIVKGTNPTTDTWWVHSFTDNEGTGSINRLGCIETVYRTTGATSTWLRAYKPENGTNISAYINVGYTASGTPYCRFTNSECVDGQWNSGYADLVSNVSFSADATKNYSLSSYLPNDNHEYEVMFTICGETGTSSGNGLEYRVYSDVLTNVNGGGVIACRTRSNSSVYAANKFIMPIGSARKIYIYNSNTQAGSTLVYLRAQGYRRIGTNA